MQTEIWKESAQKDAQELNYLPFMERADTVCEVVQCGKMFFPLLKLLKGKCKGLKGF